MTALCYRSRLVKLCQPIKGCRRIDFFDGHHDSGQLLWEFLAFVLLMLCIPHALICSVERERESWQDREQLHNHSNSCSPSYNPYFSFLTFNPVMHTFLRHFLWGVTGKQNIYLFNYDFSIFSFLRHLFQNCKYWTKILCALKSWKPSVTPKAATPQVSRNKMQSPWPITHPVQGTKEIDNHEISSKCCSPCKGCKATASSHLQELILESYDG